MSDTIDDKSIEKLMWYYLDFSIVPTPTDEEVEIEEDIPIDSPDDICAVCYTKLRWINLYYQCPDCKRIYG